MIKRNVPSHSITGVFIFLLLGLFAVFSTVMVLMGAKAYRGTVVRADVHNNSRIASSYIRSMLRADDETGALLIEEAEGIKMITLLNTYDDTDYTTRLYVYDGMLRELFTEADIAFDPTWGESICEAESMTPEFRDGLLHVKITANGTESEIIYAPRTGAGEGN